jgi:hypothetical protein
MNENRKETIEVAGGRLEIKTQNNVSLFITSKTIQKQCVRETKWPQSHQKLNT